MHKKSSALLQKPSENFADCHRPLTSFICPFCVVRPRCHPVISTQVEGGATSVERPLGLVLLDEPSVTQSDPTILELKLR